MSSIVGSNYEVSMMNEVVQLINQRIKSILNAPEMWGSMETVEVLLCELLVIRLRILFPQEVARKIRNSFEAFIEKRFPGQSNVPLCDTLENMFDEPRAIHTQMMRDFVDDHMEHNQ